MRIPFTFEGGKYTVPAEAHSRLGDIRLPDGRTLRVTKWIETDPPQIGSVSLLGEGSAGQIFFAQLVAAM